MTFWCEKDVNGRALLKLNFLCPSHPSSRNLYNIVQFRLTSYDNAKSHSPIDKQIGNLTSDALTLRKALNWFHSCDHQYTRCRQYSAKLGNWHPTRLIDLGPNGSSYWRLYNTLHDSPLLSGANYIALSYRWGPKPGLLLKSSTIQDFRQGKSIKTLLKTFRDLATVAREFSVRYIWIDALCIIQDSKEDWEVEALKMRQVYANAACTVAATASTDEEGGLFRFRHAKSILPGLVNVSTDRSGVQTMCLFGRNYWNENIFAGPLHKRGWVFQERHLSPRVLYFGNSQVLWECFQEATCEGFPQGIPFYSSDKDLSNLWDLLDRQAFLPKNDPGDKHVMSLPVYSLWRDLVKGYSQCALTKTEDKLPAFAGIAKLFQEATGDDYFAGLWRSRILEGLSWRVIEPVKKATVEYRAPSWSWASVDGPLRPELPCAVSTNLVEILEAEVQPKGSDKTGCISAGHITLRGCLIETTVQSTEIGVYYTVVTGSGHHLGNDNKPHHIKLRLDLDYLEIN
ncbi:heterokaryon incompatibility protein-domain-containing protein [Ilyonectria destructans]|nr:heterokaryon incompatibility protein-domain-containing protein [Ilyonectria destructans]